MVAIILLPIAAIAIILIAVIAALDSKSFPFFGQIRVGYKGRRIKIWKIRTFDEAGLKIIRIGQLIRPLGLDELPQLFSIAKGDMIWFGPRPRPECIINDVYVDEVLNKTKPGVINTLSLNKEYHSLMVSYKEKYSFSEMLFYDMIDLRSKSLLYNFTLLWKMSIVLIKILVRLINIYLLNEILPLPPIKSKISSSN